MLTRMRLARKYFDEARLFRMGLRPLCDDARACDHAPGRLVCRGELKEKQAAAAMSRQKREYDGPLHYVLDLLTRGFFAFFRIFPHATSLRLAGWISRRVLSPFFGVRKRIKENLDHVLPDLSPLEADALCDEVIDNSARLMMETFNVAGFLQHARNATMSGPGKEALLASLADDAPVILVSGHFGNFQVIRVLLAGLGHPSAGVYRPMNNAFTNAVYVKNLARIAGPNYSRGISGIKSLLKHLRKGGTIALLNDQAAWEGQDLEFFGKKALTMTSVAEFSLKYNAPIFPCYSIRLKNGVDFRAEVEMPVPMSDPVTMTQALNDSLEAVIRRYPGQWFWIHRRWKHRS